ncbi:hypothetical protein HGRIS_000985 [Hohenbuehelia grisea]|uniref:Fungal lipase-type domain-containing protein n=1 Tax=Hohenbuehelia grisea TaxID=104357 RepID=A0ABR3IQB4_9AGAR
MLYSISDFRILSLRFKHHRGFAGLSSTHAHWLTSRLRLLLLTFAQYPAMESTEIPVSASSNDVLTTMDRKPISSELYDDLVFYFKYASCAYNLVCPRPNGKHLVTPFTNPVTDIQGFVARDDERKEIVVAIRGSLSLTDFLMDGQLALVPMISPGVSVPHGTRVHSGFLVCWNSVSLEIIEIVRNQINKHDYSVVVVGHSLGGALTDFAGVSLKQHFPDRDFRLYSYGAPRTGNEIFAHFINEEFGTEAFRVVHTTDGVPTMIPAMLGYHHHGIEYWQHTDPASAESTTQCSADGEDPTCSASVPTGGINPAHVWYFGIMASTSFCY